MRIIVEGTSYDFDMKKLLVSEAIFIQEKTGLKFRAWQTALTEGDALATKCLVYILKWRAGESPDWNVLDFDLGSIEAEDETEVEEPGPKEAGGNVVDLPPTGT